MAKKSKIATGQADQLNGTCLYCRKSFSVKHTGRIPFYCSDKCRTYSNRKQKAAVRTAHRAEVLQQRALMLFPSPPPRSGSSEAAGSERRRAPEQEPIPEGRGLAVNSYATGAGRDHGQAYSQTVIYVREELTTENRFASEDQR